MSSPATATRNPGPGWGYAFVSAVDRLLPKAAMSALLDIGAFFALLGMKRQRQHSKRFLSEALGRPATWRDCWQRFAAFARFLVQRFRAARGWDPVFHLSEKAEDRVESLALAGTQALYGTFHFGNSDLMGFWLSRFGVSLRMIRQQVGNSDDLRWLERRFGDKVGFIFVNDPSNLLFSLKNAIQEGHSIAMKCDRIEHSSKLEAFDFLGAKRLFPLTIYHLALMFDLPVAFAIGVPQPDESTLVYSSTVYRPTAGDKQKSLAEARIHFQETLKLLEDLVRSDPYHWFNFLSENPQVDPDERIEGSTTAPA